MVKRRYRGMSAKQGKVWNALVDDDWLTVNEIKRRINDQVHANQVQYMCDKYGVEQKKINGRLMFRLPELGACDA